MSESNAKQELFIEGEEGVVHIHPKVAVGLIFRQPHALAEATEDEREAHQKLKEKATDICNQSRDREACVPCSAQEAIILTKSAFYIADDLSQRSIDKILDEAEEKFYFEASGKSKKEMRKFMEDAAKERDSFMPMAQAFERASLSEHGLTICFDKFDADLLARQGYRETPELEEIPDQWIIKIMRHDGHSDSEIAKVLEKKKKKESSGK